MMMITLLVLAALVADVAVACRMVRAGGRPARPPRSHPDDLFDPRIPV